VACKGGTGTLVELAVVWEMLNKSVIAGKPMVVLGDFWTPILERVREVELGHRGSWGEANGKLVHSAATPEEATYFLLKKLREVEVQRRYWSLTSCGNCCGSGRPARRDAVQL